jgi:hypothetical protein
MDENLGPAEPWQIRSFPKGLRERLTDEAHARRTTVGELLTAICVAHFDASNNAVHGTDASTNAIDVVRLAPLVASMPRWLRAALWRRVAGELGVEAPQRPARRALEGPNHS